MTTAASAPRTHLASRPSSGLVEADATLSDAEVWQLIFAPGFSTAGTRSLTCPAVASAWTSSLQHRGTLRGQIQLSSRQEGQGTTPR